jgi:hypothetical protein
MSELENAIDEMADEGQIAHINIVFDALVAAVNEAKKTAPTATRDEDYAIIEASIDIAQLVVTDLCRAATALERIADGQERVAKVQENLVGAVKVQETAQRQAGPVSRSGPSPA